MILYRDHRLLLADSMQTVVEINSRDELITHLGKLWPFNMMPYIDLTKLQIAPYFGEDKRIGWKETWIVSLPTFGILGFTSGPIGEAC